MRCFRVLFVISFLVFGLLGSFIEGASKIDIEADLFELDGKKNLVIASGNVIVTQRDIKIIGKRARFDQDKNRIRLVGGVTLKRGKMSLVCDQIVALGNKDIIEAQGHVKFTFSGIRGTAGFAKYDMLKQLVELKGQPRAWQGQDEISGKMISVDLEKGKIRTFGKAKVTFSVDRFKD
jgi:lipopolysaccharide transport protein LptA